VAGATTSQIEKPVSKGLCRAVILLGAPGSGKGTQAQKIAGLFSVPHLSTGDMFREHIKQGTELGMKVKPLMDRGELVPDDVVLGMVRERIARPDCEHGFVLDGFPRTVTQADNLERMVEGLDFELTTVLYIFVAPSALMRRLTGRRICKAAGHIYNIYERPPKKEGICDLDGSELIQRSDDRTDVISERLAFYERQTQPLVEYYSARGLLRSVDGMAAPDAVTASVIRILAAEPQCQ
jgi:adenylate kinase